MTEYELVSLVVERRQELMTIMQWWASVSVGIIAGSQVLARYLNGPLVSILIAFYLFFTFTSTRLTQALTRQMEAAYADLTTLQESTRQTQLMIQQFSSGYIAGTETLFAGAIIAIIAATCCYPVWVYLKEKKNQE